MGNNESQMAERKKERERKMKSRIEPFFRRMLSLAEESNLIPDIGIDFCLVKYSGLNSASELENYVKDLISRFLDYVQCLGSALAPFTEVPNAVGLSTVLLSIALELLIRGLQKSEDSVVNKQRCVLAEEKASGVRDLMEEYLKRLRMYLQQPSKTLEETERLEKLLSKQLTCLKNSMLHDDQMSSCSLKHWSNGAAFHLQMLIHAARLKMQSSIEHEAQLKDHLASISSVLDCYQSDLEKLLKQYETYKKSTISLSHPVPWLTFVPHTAAIVRRLWVVKEKELGGQTSSVFNIFLHSFYSSYNRSLPKPERVSDLITSNYVDYMFHNWTQLKEMKRYFSDLTEKINDLTIQDYEFNMQNIFPDSDD